MLLIVLMVAGINPFEYLGLQTPSVWLWTQDNKFYACLMTFFLCNAIEGQMISTGAFEIQFNGEYGNMIESVIISYVSFDFQMSPFGQNFKQVAYLSHLNCSR